MQDGRLVHQTDIGDQKSFGVSSPRSRPTRSLQQPSEWSHRPPDVTDMDVGSCRVILSRVGDSLGVTVQIRNRLHLVRSAPSQRKIRTSPVGSALAVEALPLAREGMPGEGTSPRPVLDRAEAVQLRQRCRPVTGNVRHPNSSACR
jgi:hypothetical protein